MMYKGRNVLGRQWGFGLASGLVSKTHANEYQLAKAMPEAPIHLVVAMCVEHKAKTRSPVSAASILALHSLSITHTTTICLSSFSRF